MKLGFGEVGIRGSGEMERWGVRDNN